MSEKITAEWLPLSQIDGIDEDRVFMVYFERHDSECFLDTGATFSNGIFFDSNYDQFVESDYKVILWSYWPNPEI